MRLTAYKLNPGISGKHAVVKIDDNKMKKNV